MTATLLPNGKQQFIDINGNPLVNGTVEFYVQATLTPKDTWQNSGQTILNTNPVVLDSRGQAIIYGSGVYRQIVKDEDGNTIWDQLTASNIAGTFGAEQAIASNTTTDLGTLSSNNALITGTTTITSFGTSALLANPFYVVRFSSSLTLTYNGTSMILPNGVDITTQPNDMALFEFMNVLGYWRLVSYFPANGTALSITSFETSIVSNTTTDLGSIPAHLQRITGTTTITSLGSSATFGNPLYFVRFASALTLTHNAASLILPGSANITTATNDFALFEYLGSGNWLCLDYQKASGRPIVRGSGELIQVDTYSAAGASTWNKPAGCNFIIGVVIGGGGSGGGAGVSSSGHAMASTGGGAGGYSMGLISSVASSYTITVGAKGAAPTAGANNGNAGTASSIGSVIVCNGGAAGLHGTDASTGTQVSGVAGGSVATPGNIIAMTGQTSGDGLSNSNDLQLGGDGGSGPFGGGGIGPKNATSATGTSGGPAHGPGSGGGGGVANSAGAAVNVSGGEGADGYVAIYSYS